MVMFYGKLKRSDKRKQVTLFWFRNQQFERFNGQRIREFHNLTPINCRYNAKS